MNQALKFSKNVFCPGCQRKLCKLVDTDDGRVVHIRHQKMDVWASKAVVSCVGCGRTYKVLAETGID